MGPNSVETSGEAPNPNSQLYETNGPVSWDKSMKAIGSPTQIVRFPLVLEGMVVNSAIGD